MGGHLNVKRINDIWGLLARQAENYSSGIHRKYVSAELRKQATKYVGI